MIQLILFNIIDYTQTTESTLWSARTWPVNDISPFVLWGLSLRVTFCDVSQCGGITLLSLTQIQYLNLTRLVHYKTVYRNATPIRHRPIRWITPFKYKNISLVRHHASNSNAFPFPHIGTVNAWCFPILFVQSPKLNTYLKKRYSLKCWPLRFTYKTLIGAY